MTPEAKDDDVAARLERVGGQIAGIQRMVDDDRCCMEIAMQLSAARAALAKVAKIANAAPKIPTTVEDHLALAIAAEGPPGASWRSTSSLIACWSTGEAVTAPRASTGRVPPPSRSRRASADANGSASS